MSDNRGKSKYSSTNVDQECLVQLQVMIEKILNEKKALKGDEQPSISELSLYLSNRSNVLQLVQVFSFASTINNHADVISCANVFSQLINLSSTVTELHPSVKTLIDEIISTSNIKVFYRCLNIHRPNITNPVLRLMISIVNFSAGSYVDSFIDVFDLTLKSLPHLLIPLAAEKINTELARSGKQSVRVWMIRFWIALCENASSITRNDLLSNNKKIMSHLFKYMPLYDSDETIEMIMRFCDFKILMEPAFKKATKGKILNEWALSKFCEVFQRENLNGSLKPFLVKVCTDSEHGLSFSDNRSFFVNPPFAANSTGAAISIGERSFKISNKLIYILLTHLTPWSSNTQLDLVIAILTHLPELVAPYTSHIFFNHGTHEPRLTAFYIGQSLFLTKILLIPIPADFKLSLKEFINHLDPSTNNDFLLSKTINSSHLCDVVCPPMFTRGVFVKGLNSSDSLIRHITAQLIDASIKKYSSLMEILSVGDNTVLGSLRSELRETFLQRIPEGSSLIGAVNETINPSGNKPVNKMLLVSLLKLVCRYQNSLEIIVDISLGNFGNLIGLDLGETNEIIEQKKHSNVDMLLLDTYLDLISNPSSDASNKNKWWNVSKSSKNSMFTIISKLPWTLKEGNSIDFGLVEKLVKVLDSLVKDTLIFNSNVLSSQCWAIVLSMLRGFQCNNGKTDVVDTISKILDESISRCVKTPYKYIDMASKFSTSASLSPYYFALCEQSKFIESEQKEFVLEWLHIISAYLAILGEPLNLMNIVYKNYWDSDLKFNSASFEKYIYENNNVWTTNKEESCFFDLISFSSLESLRTIINSSTIVCKSSVDAAAIIQRVSHLVYFNEEKKYQLERIEGLLIDLLSLWGNYLLQTYDKDIFSENNGSLLSSKYWNALMFKEDDDSSTILKKHAVIGLLNEVFFSVWNLDAANSLVRELKFNDVRKEAFMNIKQSINLDREDTIVERCLDLSWALNDDDLLHILQLLIKKDVKPNLIKILLRFIINKKTIIGEELYISLCSKYDATSNTETVKLLASLVEFTKLSEFTVHKFIKQALHSSFYYKILNSICLSHPEWKLTIVHSIKDSVSLIVESNEGFELIYTLSSLENSFQSTLVDKAISNIRAIIETNNIDNSILPFLKVFNVVNVEQSSIGSLVESLSNNSTFRNNASLIFSPEFTNLIIEQSRWLSNNLLRTWIHRATLYITKMFAESSLLPSSFKQFLQSLKPLYFNGTFWSNISKQMLESQLEAILSEKWVQEEEVLTYVNSVLISNKKARIDVGKLLSFFMNNSDNPLNIHPRGESLRFQAALCVWFLFRANKKLSSINFMLQVVKLYRGTIHASDVVLKRIIMELEVFLKTSWAQYITTWDYTEESATGDDTFNPKLVIETPDIHNGLTVSLNKSIINNTIKNFVPYTNSITIIDYEGKNVNEEWTQWNTIEESHKYYDVSVDQKTVYDVEFLLLLISTNEELFDIKVEGDSTNIVTNVRALIDTGFLQLCVMCLSHEFNTVNQIALKLLTAAFRWNNFEIEMIEKFREQKSKPNNGTVETAEPEFKLSAFKERSTFKVLLGNILCTIQDKEAENQPSRLSLIAWSYMVSILADPSHFLYEKSYRYLLLGSKFKPFEIPLYKSITEQLKDSFGTEESEDNDYYKEMVWLIDMLTDSVTGCEDLKLLKKINIFEYILNLAQSPYVKDSLMEAMKRFIQKVVGIENGADLLIRSYGLLSTIEGQGALSKMNIKMKGNPETWKQIGIETLVASQWNGCDKRSMEWTEGDYSRAAKRLCK